MFLCDIMDGVNVYISDRHCILDRLGVRRITLLEPDPIRSVLDLSTDRLGKRCGYALGSPEV